MPVAGSSEATPIEQVPLAHKGDVVADIIKQLIPEEAATAHKTQFVPKLQAPAEAPTEDVQETVAELGAVGENAEEAPPPAEEAPELPPKEATKAWLGAHKARRKAEEARNEARRLANQADAQARLATKFNETAGRWKEKPSALLAAAGIDPREYFQALTEEALSGGATAPPDPVEAKLQAAIEPYRKELEETRANFARQQEMVAESNVISGQILPIIKEKDCEALLAAHGNDPIKAAIDVFQACKEHYQRTGQVVPFDQAAAWLDKQHEERIKPFVSLKRFKPAEPSPPPAKAPPTRLDAAKKTAAPSRTITSNQRTSTSAPIASKMAKVSSGDKSIDEVFAALGVSPDDRF